jgi:hypothetical protein
MSVQLNTTTQTADESLSAAELAKLQAAEAAAADADAVDDEAAAMAEQYTDDDDDDSLLDFSLDEVLEGVQPAAEFQDYLPGNHIYMLRIADIAKRVQIRATGKIVGVGITYEILGTESEEAADQIGGLFSEFFILGGKVPDYEKYSADKQVDDGMSGLVTRLKAFKPTEASLEAGIVEVLERQAPRADRECMRVKITAKLDKKGEFINLRKLRVLDAHVAIKDVLEDKAETWAFYEPFVG